MRDKALSLSASEILPRETCRLRFPLIVASAVSTRSLLMSCSKMLNRAGNARRDVELGGNHFPGLTNLIIVRNKTGIHGCAARAHCRPKAVGDPFQQLEIVARLHAAPARNNNFRGGELRPGRF